LHATDINPNLTSSPKSWQTLFIHPDVFAALDRAGHYNFMASHDDFEKRSIHADEENLAASDSSTLNPEFHNDRPLTAPEDGNTQEVMEKQAEVVLARPNVHDMSSVPNGGLKAWLQVVGGFFVLFNTWGILNTFGAYQTYYESGDLFTQSSSAISWIGSIQAFMVQLFGLLSGPLYDKGHFRLLLAGGSVLIVFGQMMISLCHEYWQALLAQGFCIGIGAGCLFVPAVAILSTYFTTKLPAAVGITASGSSLGGVIYPIVFHRLLNQIGFAWTTRVLGFMMLATLAVSVTLMKPRILPGKTRSLIDWTALKEPAYLFFVIGGSLVFLGLYTPFFYIDYYVISTGITNANLGFYFLVIVNAGSVFGRIFPNIVAVRTGSFNMIIPCTIGSGIFILALIGTKTVAAAVVVSALYGFFSGTFVSVPPACFVQLSPNRSLIGTRMGMGFLIIGIGGLIGTPIAGALLQHSGWTSVWVFSGVPTLAGAVCMICSRQCQTRGKLICKA
jgi:predicted MFS family arabinose efflux permease